MRFRDVFRYELAHRLRSASTYLYGGLLVLLGFWIVHVAATGFNPIFLNAPQPLAEKMALVCGLFGMLVTCGLCADAVLRDRAAHMEPLLFTTRLRPAEYLLGRFLAVVTVNGALAFGVPAGLALGSLMPYLPSEAFGPNRLAAYLQPMLLFVLPNVVLIAAILFAVAALTRQAAAVYVAAIAIFIAYIAAASYWSGITSPLLSALADPFGTNTLKGMAEYWTASERNARLVGFPPLLLWNRLLWLGIAAIVIAVLQRIFRFSRSNGRLRAESMIDAPGEARWTGAVPAVEGTFGSRTGVRHMLVVARQSLAEVMSGRVFAVAFLAAIGLVLLWGWNVGETVYDTITWPVTHLVAGVVLSQRAIVIPWLVIAVYAGELVWKDRETRAAEIADSLPVRTGTVLLGRFVALIAIIATFQVAFLIGGVLLQVLHGYYQFEPGLYLRILFGIKLVDYVLLAAFAMTLHVLVNQKYVGHVIVLATIVFTSAAQYGWHHLALYNSGPQWTYSEMNGFGPYVTPFVWFKLCWAAWALLLGVVAFLFWVRGSQTSVRERLETARARFSGRTVRVAGAAIVMIAAFGGFVFYNTNVLNEPPSAAQGGRSAGRVRAPLRPVSRPAAARHRRRAAPL